MELTNFIKYCLGYVKLTQQGKILSQEKYSAALAKSRFSLEGLLNGDVDGSSGELINLETFYRYDPAEVPAELGDIYKEEKALANRLEDIYNKYKNDQFTKQVNFNFGYFDIELPGSGAAGGEETENPLPGNGGTGPSASSGPAALIGERFTFPLFTLTVRIEKDRGQYTVYPADPAIRVNAAVLEPLLGEELYYQLAEAVGKYELEGRLSIPASGASVFQEFWQLVKSSLKLKDASFTEDSFTLERMTVSLGLRANYFLAEDLQKLSGMKDEDLSDTALLTWTDDQALSREAEIPDETGLYFPFLYDKFQLRTLTLLNNRASIIQGPPGTGKSETIANLLAHLAATGRRVLFVSQKAQALKVVKNKLKRLDARYLFGYVPNPRSAELSEEDEWDGVASQLTSLDAFAGEADGKENLKADAEPRSLEDLVLEKRALKEAVNRSISAQRTFYKLSGELKELGAFDVPVSDPAKFKENFSEDQRQKILSLKEALDKYAEAASSYGSGPERDKYAASLGGLEWKNEFSGAIAEVRGDAAKTGYDRNSKIMRWLNARSRRTRLKKTFALLPREIYEAISGVFEADLSRADQVKELDSLHRYSLYRGGLSEAAKAEEELRATYAFTGLSEEEYRRIEALIQDAGGDFKKVSRAVCRSHEIREQIASLEIPDTNGLNERFAAASAAQKEKIKALIKKNAEEKILAKWKNDITVRRLVKKLSKAFGKSKKAFRTFDKLRNEPENFKAVLEILPIWIMELDDASRLIPLEPKMFDYVILDEASQCNIAYTLPVMYRASKAIFVGDSEQMRDSTIMFKSNRSFEELARRYGIPEEMQIKSAGSAVQSVLDIAGLRGFLSIPLRYHYRSPSELISFSNKYFYKPKGKSLIALNSNYLPYAGTNRIMMIHRAPPVEGEDLSGDVNAAEAQAVLDFFSNMKKNGLYKDKSVGILTFFNSQAALLRETFEKAGFQEDRDNFKISIIEGIQGDEKDIILYSFVLRESSQKSRYVPLTGEGGDIRGDINKGRVNVAFSRARLQAHCFTSVSIEEFPEDIWIKKYLRHADDCGRIADQDLMNSFESAFEEELFHELQRELPTHYKIRNQVRSCGFKIDFVIMNPKNGKRLAVECDGPSDFRTEADEESGVHASDDEERQRVLEAAGWKFYRVGWTDWKDRPPGGGPAGKISELLS